VSGSPTSADAAPGPGGLPGIRRALVVGLGASGSAAARALARADVEVVLVDDAPDHPAAQRLRSEGFEVVLGRRPVEAFGTGVDLVVPSPGVPQHAPVLLAAAERQVPVWSEPELAWRLYPGRLVAVTGTNGKTSVTQLLAAMLQAGDVPAVVCGNIGTPVCDAAANADADTVLVAELSSFQLRFAGTLRPEVGVLLNLAADHLDWHGDLAAYGAAKARLWEAQRPEDWAVANADDPRTMDLLERLAPAGRASFSATHEVPLGVGRRDAQLVAVLPSDAGTVELPLLDVDRLAAPVADHVVANVAAAACAAALEGVPPAAIAAAATAFRPGRHRYETVVTDDRGVRFVDDSKATNVHAAIAALNAAGSVVWIAGGIAKGVSLAPLGDHLAHVRAAVLIGEAADELEGICADRGVRARRAASIEEAVEQAAALALPGDTVLLAPACASFDQFRDYAERGDRFAAAARRAGAQPVGGSSRRPGGQR
jgi:UDP-N-acetylmuramoylalanine--D-glutamate ligase